MRLRRAIFLTPFVLAAAGCSGGPARGDAGAWADRGVDAVSRPVSGAGVAAVTGLRTDGTLETVVDDLATGKRRWAEPAALDGRLTGMGVQPPAVAGDKVVAVEPAGKGAQLVGRDATSGRVAWRRPVASTYGPQRCGTYVCLAEGTAAAGAYFSAVNPANGATAWKIPGIAEVEADGGGRVVLLRMAEHPVLQSFDVAGGRPGWAFALEQGVGRGVNLSGGWAFGSAGGGLLVGYVGPYQAKLGARLSAYGFFALDPASGRPLWTRPNLLRVYPSASPAVALITREVDAKGGYGAFDRLDPASGRTVARLPASGVPSTAWWLAFPANLAAVGFLVHDQPGTAIGLTGSTTATSVPGPAWSFCTVTPKSLQINGRPGFYPVAALCPYDLSTGRRVPGDTPPPGWYTGSAEGRRLWRDDSGVLHAIHDTTGTVPGMYG